jgi:hypothetical protein
MANVDKAVRSATADSSLPESENEPGIRSEIVVDGKLYPPDLAGSTSCSPR